MKEFGAIATRLSMPATRLEAYLELARRARERRDPFTAETIFQRAVLEARTVREAARVAEVVFLSWGTEDDRYFRPMKRQIIEHALATAIALADSQAELEWLRERAAWMAAHQALEAIDRR